MPWDPKFRKQGVQGITANAIDVVIETGDSGPITPVGINLPNDQSIREQYGSKSVSLSNVNEAYDKSTLPEFRSEFSWTPEEAARASKWSALAGELTTNMHEVIGHASGKIEERLNGNPQTVLKEQYSALEEARADLVALYFLPDPKLVEIGAALASRSRRDRAAPSTEAYTRERARPAAPGPRGHADRRRSHAQPADDRPLADGQHEGDRRPHARRQDVLRDDRPAAFREGVGRLLAEVQRIKAEGDYAAAKQLFETYGVHFDPRAARRGRGARRARCNLPSYSGFVMPRLEAVRDGDVGESRRQDFLSAGSDVADAGVRGRRRGVFVSRAGDVFARVPADLGVQPSGAGRSARRGRAGSILDLTESNPTRAGFDYPADLLAPLADPRGLRLRAEPVRPAEARARAVAREYERRGTTCRPAPHRADGQHERRVFAAVQAALPRPATRCWCRGPAIRFSIT